MPTARPLTAHPLARPRLADAPPPAATPEVDVDIAVATEERRDDPWRVILFNDDIHSFDEVILQLVKATGCTTMRAAEIAFRAHMQGKAAAYEGSFEECFRVQGVLNEIRLVTELEG